MKVTVKRIIDNDKGMFGVMLIDNMPVCVTLEDSWKDNKKNVSCIPSGTYKVVQHNGEKFKGVWRLLGVPNREGILIHAGNSHHDTHGCLLVGRTFMPFGIGSSQIALDDLRGRLPAEFEIEIINP